MTHGEELRALWKTVRTALSLSPTYCKTIQHIVILERSCVVDNNISPEGQYVQKQGLLIFYGRFSTLR